MKQRYDEIMEHIEVTEEMRGRILQNIRKAPAAPQKKPIRFARILRVGAAAAACAAVIFAGGRITMEIAAPMGSTGNETSVATAPQDQRLEFGKEEAAVYADGASGITEYQSAEALAQAAGYSVPQLQALPFAVESVRYACYSGTMAEIEYSGKNGEWARLRKGSGEDPVSGNYNEYPQQTELTLHGEITVQLKGEADGYTLAEWGKSGYAYSLQLSEAQSLDWWQSVLNELEQQEEKS